MTDPARSLVHSIEQDMLVRRTCREGVRGQLIWVHGLGESGLCFERLVQQPALDGWEHVVPDLPGYGRSPWPPRPMSLADTSDHLAAWISERCARGRAIVVGHSMGGVVALILAERHPASVAGVVSVDANISIEDCAFSSRAAALSEAEFVRRGLDRLRDDIYVQGVEDEGLRGYYASLRLADPRTYHLHSQELVAASTREDMAARLASLPVPAFYVAAVPRGVCARSLSLLDEAGVPVVRVGPAGHWPFVDRPADSAVELARLAEIVAAASW